jgi:DNA-binding transcriptional MerR regulator
VTSPASAGWPDSDNLPPVPEHNRHRAGAPAVPDRPAESGGSPARPDRSGQPALLSIGEVLAELRGEFPDTTISKLRFLEAEGLVQPQRTPAGYRKYSREDVARLRYVLTAQRDHYLPLRVIREHLHRGDELAGRRPALVAVGDPGTARAPAAGTDPSAAGEVRLSRADLIARAGIDDTLLAGMQEHGLVAPRAGGWYDGDALAIAEAVRDLAAYGLQPRHLRGHRTAADREVGLFAQLVTPLARQADPAAMARAADTVRELTALSQRLHAALIRAGLRKTIGR